MQGCYHGILRGHTINELIKKVDPRGRTVNEILQEEICNMIQAKFYIGLPEQMDPYATTMILEGSIGTLKSSLPLMLGTGPELIRDAAKYYGPGAFSERWTTKSFNYKAMPEDGPACSNLKRFHRASIPSCSGMSNARSIALLLNWFMSGGVSSETLKKALKISTPPTLDVGIGVVTTFTDGGFAKDLFESKLGGYFGWAGYGGSVTQFCPEIQVAFSYCMNGLTNSLFGSPRFDDLFNALNNCIEKM